MRVSRRLLLLSAIPLALAACGESAGPGAAKPVEQEFGIPETQPVTLEAVKASGAGFVSGQQMSTRQVFVFFDPQCPHCAMLWHETKAMPNVRFTWLPVALMNKNSLEQGAAILAATDPRVAMDAHAEAFRLGKPLTATEAASPQFKAAVTKNTRLLTSFGANGVPFIVAKHAVTGDVFTRAGGMTAVALTQALGWVD